MHTTANRVLATVYAVGLGIGEAVMNWGNWQYAPLWIVDYLIVVALLVGAFQSSQLRSAQILKAGWAFSLGVMYMAFFVSIEPEMAQYSDAPLAVLVLIGLLIATSAVGLLLSFMTENVVREFGQEGDGARSTRDSTRET